MPATTVADPSLLTNAQTPQTLQAWSNLLDSIFPPTTNQNSSGTSSSTTTQSTSSEANDPIKQLLALLIPGSMGGVSNPQSQAMIQDLLTKFKEGAGGLSGIAAAGNSAGVYNSSTQGLLANDAMARAIAAAAGTIGTQQNQQQQIIAQLLATLSAGSRSSTTNQAGTTSNQQSSSKSGGGGSAAGKGLLGAGAAAAAAKALKDAFGGGINNQNTKFNSSGDQEGDYPQGSGTSVGNVGAELGTDFPPDGTNSNNGSDYNSDSDPAAFYGTEDAGANGISDPFGVNGIDLGDFLSNDGGGPNFDFIDFSDGNQSGDIGGDLGTDFEG